MKEEKKKIGEILVEAGIINSMQLSAALGEQRQWGGRLGSIIIKLGFADEKDIAGVLEEQLGQSCISLEDRVISPDVLKKVKADVARKYGIIPIDFDKGSLTVAMSDPTDLGTIDELGFTLGVRIKPVLALDSGISRAIALHYGGVMPEIKAQSQKTILKASPDKSLVMKDERVQVPPTPLEKEFRREPPPEKKESSVKAAVEALLALLIEKGVITKEELIRKMKEKNGA